MKELVQKKGREFRKYALGENGLNAETLVQGSYQSTIIKYEDIGFNETITKKSPSIYKILLVVSLFINLILIFLVLAMATGEISSKPILIFSGITLFVSSTIMVKSLFTSSIEKHLTGTAKIEFDYEKRERQKVDAFIASLNIKQRDYMRKKYMRIDQLIPAEQQSRVFLWLFKSNFITRSELEVLLEETEKLRTPK